MSQEAISSDATVLTDHTGWPVAVSEGAVWWMVAEVTPAEGCPVEGEFFKLQLTNGQSLIAQKDHQNRQWRISGREKAQ